MAIKKRYWALLGYPDSMDMSFFDWLRKSGLKYSYILHDKDEDDDGIKKSHYHIELFYDSPTTENNISNIVKSFNLKDRFQALDSPKGFYDYLIHSNQPEKHLYSPSERIDSPNLNISYYINKEESLQIRKEIIQLILKFNIIEYCDLVNYCIKNLDTEYSFIVMNNTLFFNTYLSSYRNSIKNDYKR